MLQIVYGASPGVSHFVSPPTAPLTHVAGTRDCVEFLHWLRHPLRDSIKGLETGYKNAVAAGNPAYAGGCAYALAGTLWAICPLPQILSTIGTQSSQAQWSEPGADHLPLRLWLWL